jgi:CheY-like chemotaxis protein
MLRGGLQTDAVVYDATMPMMGGRAFVRQLRSEGSGTPVLLMTGMRPSRGGRRRCAPTR